MRLKCDDVPPGNSSSQLPIRALFALWVMCSRFFERNLMSTFLKAIVAVVAIYAVVAVAGARTGTVAKQKIVDRHSQIEQILEAAK